MEITFLWSWASFIAGALATVFVLFLAGFAMAAKNYRAQKRNKEGLGLIKKR